MPRYIDADKLWNDRPLIPEGKSQEYMAGFSECMWGFSKRIKEQIDNPTADKVAGEIFKSIYRKIDYYKRYREVNDTINNFFVLLEEVEKEYTGG